LVTVPRLLQTLALSLSLSILAAAGCRGDDTNVDPVPSTGGGGSTSSGVGGNAGGGGSGGYVGGPFILQGTVVTPDQAFEGQVLIDGDTILCAAEGTTCQDMDATAVLFDTGGIIAPGLIDTHNHIMFDIFDETDWAPNLTTCSVPADCNVSSYCNNDCDCVGGQCRYMDHDQWPDEDEYGLMLDYKQCLEDASQGKPVWCPLLYDGDGKLKCEMNKWGELKGLVAGTTSIVGLPGTSSKCFGSLSRSIDVSQNDLGDDNVQTSALFPPSGSSADSVCGNFTDGDTEAYLIHVGEGVNQNALDEFATLFSMTSSDGCLYAPQTAITHGTSFGSAEFAQMAAAGMKLTWSPASNVSLYGATADIPAALAEGLTISLAPDWSMGGSQNILDELAFAKSWSQSHGWGLTDKQLIEMVTTNAAAVLALANKLGRLEAGYLADIVVIEGDSSDPYGAIVAATPANVSLVMIGGVSLYGDDAYDILVPADLMPCSSLDLCGSDKFLCAAEASTEDKLDQSYETVRDALEAGLTDLDSIPTLASAACGDTCAVDESCFLRTVHPQVAESNCPAPCGTGEACYQTALSGSSQYNCLSVNVCYPAKTHNMAPLTPLVRCN
jgi:5-methylthioadenosine/S-adenosylhomocysteine deaminase